MHLPTERRAVPRSGSRTRPGAFTPAVGPPRFALFAALFLALFLTAALASAAAQTTASDLSLAEIDAAAQAIEADPDLSDTERAELLDIYEQVRTALASRDRWRDEDRRLREEFDGAEQTLTVLREELQRPALAPDLATGQFADLEEVENQLDVAQSELARLRTEADALSAERQQRAARRAQLPGRIVDLRSELQELDVRLATPIPEGDPRAVANRASLRARNEALQAELVAVEEELRGHELLSTVLSTRKRVQDKHIAAAQATVEALEREADRRRGLETQRSAEEAADTAARVADYHPSLRDAAERNADLARSAADLVARMEELGRARARASDALDDVRNARNDADRRSVVARYSDAVGALLRKQRTELPNASVFDALARTRREERTRVQLDTIQFEDALEDLADADAAIAGLIADAPDEEADRIAAEAAALIAERQALLERLIQNGDEVFFDLAELEFSERSVVEATREFERYIDERVLWIRSSPQLFRTDFSGLDDALAWVVSPDNWMATGDALRRDVVGEPILFGAIALVLGALFAGRRRARAVIQAQGDVASRSSCFHMKPTWKAVAATAALTLGAPLLVWFLGVRLEHASDVTGFSRALGSALQVVALVVAIVEALRYTALPNGLGASHFGWTGGVRKRLDDRFVLLPVAAIPLLGVTLLLEEQPRDPWKDSLGRVALIAALALVLVFLYTQARQYRRAHASSSWERRVGAAAQVAGVLLPLALIVLALTGYSFTAVQLVGRLFQTAALALAVALGYAIANRGLLVTKRRIAIDQARRLRAAKAAESAEGSTGEPNLEELAVIDVHEVGEQSRQMLGAVAFVALLAGAWWIWADVLPALQFLERIELWHYSGDGPDAADVPVTLGGLLGALAILGAILLANRNLPGLLEVSVLQRLSIGPGERYAVKAILRYALGMIGIIWAFGVLGIGWSKVQWLAAAVSVGLGFGLQEIFANFVSGLIILGERPVRVGDWVTAGEVTGKVTRVHMRATTLVDRDNREWLIPNKEIITQRLSNWTLSEQITRVVIPVGVAYGSDTDRAVAILVEIAKGTQHVLESPPPNAVFLGFGDNALNLELRFFIDGRDVYPAILHPVNSEIHRRFADAGIEIAFPQRDLHIRSAEGLEALLGARAEPLTE